MWSPQQGAVQGGIRRRLRPRYLDEIRGRYGEATQSVIEQRSRDLAEKSQKQNYDMQRKSLDMQKQQMKQQEKENRYGAGLQTVGLASNLFKNFGDKKMPGFMGGGSMGASLGAGLAGFGLSSVLGGDTTTNILAGAASTAATSGLFGKTASKIGGGIMDFIGGLF
jgi:hypothetical protein